MTRSPIVVFDTDCVLCSGMVAFVLKYEESRTLRFAGAWSAEGLKLAAQHGFSKSDLNETFLVVINDKALSRSDAGFEILSHLRLPWRFFVIGRFFPRILRDEIYTFVARRRYSWFGRRENCVVVPECERDRFIGLS